jgi:pilus assembly protein Flp/PilA
MRSLIVRFIKEEEGMEMVEWALVAGLVLLVGATVFNNLGNAVNSKLSQLTQAVQASGNN